MADSALYSKEGLNQISDIHWVTRVPETIRKASEAILPTNKEEMIVSQTPGYSFRKIESDYAGIRQRWLIVFSQKAYEKEYQIMSKNINKENEKWAGSSGILAIECLFVRRTRKKRLIFSRKKQRIHLQSRWFLSFIK